MNTQLNNNQHTILKKNEEFKSFLERFERPYSLSININYNISYFFSELKAKVYFPEVIRIALASWKMVFEQSLEQEALLSIYRNSLSVN